MNEMFLNRHGDYVEEYVRRLAGQLGIPDFVYRPVLARVGSGNREVSDGLLVAGNDGLIVQVKSREPVAGSIDEQEKAERWCLKAGRKARRQGSGTRRRLRQGGVQVRSLRGFDRILPETVASWPIAVVLHHPANPPVTFGRSSDTLFLSLADWRELHYMVRSTAGIITYVQRALASAIDVPLGGESQRYGQLAAADSRSAESTPTSVPILPGGPLSGKDRFYASLFDDLVERVADPIDATGWDSDSYLLVVEQLDRIPLLARVRIGTKMEQSCLDMKSVQARRSFVLAEQDASARLAFLYDFYKETIHGEDGECFIAQTAAYGALRHQHALDAGADLDSPTLAIGVLHHPQHGRRYAFSLYRGELKRPLPSQLRAQLEAEFGVFTGATVVDRY